MAVEDTVCCSPIIIILIVFGLPFFLSVVRIVMQYERGLRFRLGKFIGMSEPGVVILVPFIDSLTTVDLRMRNVDIPKQEALTKDNISIMLNAVVFYKILDPQAAVLKVQNYKEAILQHGQAAMRDIAGSVDMDTLLSDRDAIAAQMEKAVSKEVAGWGIQIVAIKIQDIELPMDMKRAMARQAQAERDKRATVIVSLGEVEASETLAKAANIIASSPGALHLRTLQALSTLSSDKTNTITYLLPIEGQVLPGDEDRKGPHVPAYVPKIVPTPKKGVPAKKE